MTIQGTKLRENSENLKSFLSFFREEAKKFSQRVSYFFQWIFAMTG